ncbi:demethylmenaquinone methyltransferase [Enterococcus sp. DIV0876]|uniref:demethylmenaquinone methyltransferase n=1 Tax=Enterococcus sp. DIV0876 TaxID=2774633 RepID=UPI003D2FC71E
MEHPSKETKVHQVFERIAPQYDPMNSIISFHLHKRWRRDVMKMMCVETGSKILDVCCGTGEWSLALAKAAGATGHVTGVDFSGQMLSVAKQKALPMDAAPIDWQIGNAMALTFDDAQFDYVTIGFGLRNVADHQQVLQELYRVVKPGGRVVCLETSQPEMAGWKQLFRFYFHYVMPFLGRIFAKSFKEYAWLQESAQSFPGKNQLQHDFEQAGFHDVQIKSYAGGVTAMHMGSKS